MKTIDLNCDMGEGFGVYSLGDDEAMLDIVTSANIACGFHAGDPLVMAKTLAGAGRRGVGAGAHPSFLDLWGFGRRPILGDRPEDVTLRPVAVPRRPRLLSVRDARRECRSAR
jgi:UPF0271 protein